MRHTLILYIYIMLGALSWTTAAAQHKREFRGAWIQCVNGQFIGMTTAQMKSTLTHQLDVLADDGVNAIIFQVRPECDALYESGYEPWSRFLTGTQGKAPNPYWDPLAWMVEECHKRSMELHAWINPYRAKTKGTDALDKRHVAVRYPQRVFAYDGQYILHPSMPENREYICRVVADIVRRYDIDGLHIDDYFYPYPVSGVTIPDERLFRAHPDGFTDIGDWRRHNVNLFIEQLHDTIASVKPWVKFGVSPFGIYRNAASSPSGSDTRGLQNYDDLYADVLLWVNAGWIDYCVPQLYWQIGHSTADYATLIKWWNNNAYNRQLYIGEDVERTAKYADTKNASVNQMPAKYALHEQMDNVDGAVLWYAKAVVDDIGNYGSMLRTVYWKYPALVPTMPYIDRKAPKKVKKLKALSAGGDYVLFWTAPKGKTWKDRAVLYVVYRFADKERVTLDDPSHIVAVTPDTYYKLPYEDGETKWTYVVTALDRMKNESGGVKVKVKL